MSETIAEARVRRRRDLQAFERPVPPKRPDATPDEPLVPVTPTRRYHGPEGGRKHGEPFANPKLGNAGADLLLEGLEAVAGVGQFDLEDNPVTGYHLWRLNALLIAREQRREHHRERHITPCAWTLPHEGADLESCGTWGHQAHSTASALHGRNFMHDCARFECPRCRCHFNEHGKLENGRGWEIRESRAINERIAYALDVGHERGKPIHIVVSPPQGDSWFPTTLGEYRDLKHVAYKTAKRAGFRGGAWIFHHQRIPSRFNERTHCADGPHFHAIGFGWILGMAHDVHASPGWIVKNLGVRKGVFGTALYVLSHASRPVVPGYPALERGTRPDGRLENPFLGLAVTWMGSLSYNRIPMDPDAGAERVHHCTICKRDVPADEWFPVEPPPGWPPPDKPSSFVIPEGEGWYFRPEGYLGRMRQW